MTQRRTVAGFRLPMILLAIVLAYGTAGYVLIEGWSPGDAAYMTVTTISTVGYGEVHPLTPAGRAFTVTLIVAGVGTMLYAFGVFAEMLSTGYFGDVRRRRRVENRLQRLRDHFIVCGYGRIGTRIVSELDQQGASWVVVDNNPDALARLETEERLHIAGDASSETVLRAAGIDRARCLICAVDSDEKAVYITLAARALNPKLYLIARAGQPESIRRLELAGSDRVISPYGMAGHRMAELALRPSVVDVLDTLQHGDSLIGVEELLVSPTCSRIGSTLAEAGLLEGGAHLLALRRRDGQLHVAPAAGLRLEDGDLLIALGTQEQLLATANLVT